MERFKVNPVSFLIVASTVGYFGLVALFFFRHVPPEAKEVLMVTIGVIGNAWGGIVGYYFGSSSGSAKKTDLMLTKKEGE